MPYAANGQISQDVLPGGIVISEAQYSAALDGMLEGKEVRIEGGALVVEFPVPEETPEPETPPPPPVSLCQMAGARLTVDQDAWDVTGVERSTGISGAFLADVDTVYVFFNEPQPDDNYEVVPATGVTKFPEYVEVARPGLTDIVFIVQRVQ